MRKRKFSVFEIAIRLLFAIVVCCAGVSQTAAQQTETVTIRNSYDLVRVVRTLIANGRYDDARRVITTWQPGDKTYSYRVRYVEGLIQKARKDYPAAIATFRGILAERPEFSFVRVDLTETLFLANQDDAAKYQAEMLIAAGVDDKVGGGLKAIVGEIDDRRPVRFRSYASVLPSTNLNQGTDNSIVIVNGLPFVVDSGSKRKSGVGFLLGGELLLRQSFSTDNALVGSLGLAGRFYPSIETTYLTVNAQAGIEHKIPRGLITTSLIAEQDYSETDAFFRSFGGRIETSRLIGEAGRIYGSATFSYRDYLDNSYQDGTRAELTGYYDRFVGAGRFFRFIGGATAEKTQTSYLSYNELSAGLGFYSELPMGFTAYVQGVYANRQYLARAPFADETRRDHRVELMTTLTKRDLSFHGLAPQVTYSFTRNISNSTFDDYTSHSFDVRLVKEF